MYLTLCAVVLALSSAEPAANPNEPALSVRVDTTETPDLAGWAEAARRR